MVAHQTSIDESQIFKCYLEAAGSSPAGSVKFLGFFVSWQGIYFYLLGGQMSDMVLLALARNGPWLEHTMSSASPISHLSIPDHIAVHTVAGGTGGWRRLQAVSNGHIEDLLAKERVYYENGFLVSGSSHSSFSHTFGT